MKLLTVVISLLLTFSLYGQSDRIELGLIGGINFSYYKFYDNDGNFEHDGPTPRLYVGFYDNLYFFKRTKNILSMRGEGGFAIRGGNYTQNINLPGINLWFKAEEKRYDLFSIWAMQANFGKKIKFFVNSGIMAAATIKNKVHYQAGGLGSIDRDTTCWVCRGDFGFVFGTGFSFQMGKKIMGFVESRYTLGLVNVYEGFSQRTRTPQILMGIAYVRYPKSKKEKEKK